MTPARPVPPARLTRWHLAAWVLIMLVSGALIWRDHANFQLGAQWDDADYVVLARSLAGPSTVGVVGGQYGLINDPSGPARANYPFVFPLLLAPLAALFPGNYEILKLVPQAATLFNLTLLFWGWPEFGRGASRWWGLGVTALYGLSPLVVRYAGMIMSEAPFLAWCLTAVWLVERVAAGRAGRYWPVALGALLLGLTFTRTVGFLTLAGLVGYLLYRRGRAALPGLAAAALTSLALAALVVALTAVRWADLWPASYLQMTAGLVSGEARETSQNVPYPELLLRLAGRHVSVDVRNVVLSVGGGPGTEALMDRLGLPWLPPVVGYLLSGLIALGWVRLLRRPGLSAFLAAALAYYAGMQLVLWITARFLYPIQPQLYLGLLAGVDGVGRLAGRWLRRAGLERRLGVAAALLTFAGLAAVATVQSLKLDNSRLHAGDLEARTLWLRANVPADAVVMSELPRADYLYSGRHTLGLQGYGDEAVFAAALDQQGVDYIVSGPGVLWTNGAAPVVGDRWKVMEPIVQALVRAGRLQVAYASPTEQVVVYRVVAR